MQAFTARNARLSHPADIECDVLANNMI